MLLLAALVLASLGLAACSGGGEGVMAPDFRVPRLDGRGEVALADLRGSPVVLNFWASWCGPCREEMPDFARFADLHPEVRVVGLAVNDGTGAARAFARRTGAGYILGVDERGDVHDRYGSPGLPNTYVIDAEGRLVATWVKQINLQDLEEITRPVR
jgi:thiol-disulfide isomerase/thioredoxin